MKMTITSNLFKRRDQGIKSSQSKNAREIQFFIFEKQKKKGPKLCMCIIFYHFWHGNSYLVRVHKISHLLFKKYYSIVFFNNVLRLSLISNFFRVIVS